MRNALQRLISCTLIAALIAGSSPLALADEQAPVAGDLTHLTFTATTGLWARILSPAPDSSISAPAVNVEVAVGMGQGAEVQINGEVVPTSKIGKRVIDGPENQTRYTFYGVALQAGANLLSAAPIGAGSSKGKSVTETIYGAGEPASLEASISGNPVADGRSILILSISAFDRLHHPARLGSLVKVAVSAGDAGFIASAASAASQPTPQAESGDATPAPTSVPSSVPSSIPSSIPSPVPSMDVTRTTPSLDLTLENGGATEAKLLSGTRPGDVIIQMSSGDVHIEKRFFLAPALRAPLVVGLASVGIGQVPAAPGEDPTVPDGANSRRGRVALFASGNVGDQTLMTLAYDTADALARTTGYGAFGQSDALANRPYEIVGDGSVTRDDALSNDHLYLRFDRRHSSALWGEFQAQTGVNGGDGFNLLVDGAKLDLANDSGSGKLMLFNARNDIAYARQILNPLGLSTVGTLLHPAIVVGSDNLTLVTLDRRTGAIVQETQLQPNLDYTLDYNAGELRFINIPMPYDQNFNPQQIVVRYEYDGPGVNAETTGARVELGTPKLHLGAGYANDAYGTGNFSLLSENLSGTLHGGGWSLEHLTSQGLVSGDQANQLLDAGSGGGALRAALSFGGSQDAFKASFDSTTAGFDNPFGGLSAPGLLAYSAAYTHTLRGDRGQLTFNFDHESNSTPLGANSLSQGAINLQRKLTKRFSLTAGVNALTGPANVAAIVPAPSQSASASPVPSPLGGSMANATSLQASLGFDWRILPTVDLNASRLSDIGNATVASQPGQTNAELGIDFPRKGRAYVREIWSDAPIASFASSTISLTNPVSGTHSTAIGFQRSVGKATTVDSEYTVQQTANGSNITSSMGVQEKLQISKALRGNLDVQRGIGIGPGAVGAFNVYGADLSYSAARLRATGSYQLRTGDAGGSSLNLGATGAISPDFSLVALLNDSSAGGLVSDDERVGLAYRPSGDDRGVTLLQYDLQNSSSAVLGTHAATISLDQAFHPTDKLELAARYAYKLDGDAYYPAQSELFGLRIDQRISTRLDLGSEVRYLDVRHIPGASAVGFAVESGVRLGNEMRLAFGYNFSGAPDPQLAAAPTRRGVYVTLTSVIDRILGWGR